MKRIITTYRAGIIGLLAVGGHLGAQAQNACVNAGNLHVFTGAQVAYFGNLQNDGSFTSSGGTLYFAGSALQTVSGSETINTYNDDVQNPDHVRLENRLEVANQLTFTSGKILSDRSDVNSVYLNFLAGSSYTGLSDTTFVDGVVRKTGNTAFVFPVGEGSDVQAVAISAPANAGDHFTAYYTHTDPDADALDPASFGSCINNVSRCEYWILNRTGGSSNVNVTLDFDANSCGVTDPCELLLVHWNGSQWESLGNGGTTGSTSAGTVTGGDGCGICGSPTPVSSFSPFTLGSSSPVNPLPVELLVFDAKAGKREVDVFWQTATEINNEYFTVERSRDLIHYEYVAQVPGAGNSNSIQNYGITDTDPYMGVSYYRLRQTDYDGTYKYYGPRSVHFGGGAELSLYPNPVQDGGFVTIDFGSDETEKSVDIFDETGRRVYLKQTFYSQNLQIPIQNWASGMYFVQITQASGKEVKKLIVD